ncbi:Hypothetical predicted protein [Pelobates cultripes]|uniref:Uncharacterized protein n=1 Tax=Pelobates cultripes TaxID=61616 RepID=A0AAD1RB99_PELCU|nr:Hypothetical predicted protein [Pelobates cultripes]
MDELLRTPTGPSQEALVPNMAPTSLASTYSHGEHVTLADIRVELRRMTAVMVTKDDLYQASNNLHTALKSEVGGLKADFAVHKTPIASVEQRKDAMKKQTKASDIAIQKQGDLLLAMRRQLEDLDNRSHRNNIRIRGIPEADGTGENVAETLTQLFRIILREDALDHYRFDRAHRALRPCNADGVPRGIICCIHSYPLKDQIMQRARTRSHWTYRGSEVALYNNLSPMTLDARRTLRPVTTTLWERNIPYSINVRHQTPPEHSGMDTPLEAQLGGWSWGEDPDACSPQGGTQTAPRP